MTGPSAPPWRPSCFVNLAGRDRSGRTRREPAARMSMQSGGQTIAVWLTGTLTVIVFVAALCAGLHQHAVLAGRDQAGQDPLGNTELQPLCHAVVEHQRASTPCPTRRSWRSSRSSSPRCWPSSLRSTRNGRARSAGGPRTHHLPALPAAAHRDRAGPARRFGRDRA